MFTQTAGGRPAPGLGGTRLQNGKLASTSTSSWLPSPASRNTFAQTLGGQQAPPDLSNSNGRKKSWHKLDLSGIRAPRGLSSKSSKNRKGQGNPSSASDGRNHVVSSQITHESILKLEKKATKSNKPKRSDDDDHENDSTDAHSDDTTVPAKHVVAPDAGNNDAYEKDLDSVSRSNYVARPTTAPKDSLRDEPFPLTPDTPVSKFARDHATIQEPHDPTRKNSSFNIDDFSREFPSLGAPLQQQSSTAQSMWSNPSLRASSQQNQGELQRNNQTLQLQSDDLSQFGSNNEAYRFGGTSNQLAGLAQTPTQAQGGDDFPPLGDNDSRSLLGAFSSQPGAGLTSRLGLEQGAEQGLRGLGDRNPTPRGRTLTNPNPFPVPESSQSLNFGSLGGAGFPSAFSNANPAGFRSRATQLEYSQGNSNALSPDLPFGQIETQNPSSNTAAPRSRQVSGQSTKTRLADMSQRQREGLLGLAARLDPEHPDFSPLAVGQDLTQLGLDVHGPDTAPLYATLATPFGPANQTARPALPDFTLPAAYRVQNVPPLHEKIPSFSDEALLAVFYSMPRDLAQELAAQELYNRDWRWHIRHRFWLQKDQTYTAPTRVNMKEERGFYVVWNAQLWRKERREFTLNYDDLEQRASPPGFN